MKKAEPAEAPQRNPNHSDFANELFMHQKKDAVRTKAREDAQRQVRVRDYMSAELAAVAVCSALGFLALTRYSPTGVALRLRLMRDPRFRLVTQLKHLALGGAVVGPALLADRAFLAKNPYAVGLMGEPQHIVDR